MENTNPPLFCLLIKNTWQKLSRYYNQQLIDYDLSVPKALLLLEISPDCGENPKSLASKLDLESSSMTGLLDRLEKKGLVERRPDPRDRRSILIFLTPHGITARENIKALVEQLDRKVQEALPADDIKNFRRIISVISKQIS
jgi:MarR family transcriptional regulator, organic hydroperoxide resistance regulator